MFKVSFKTSKVKPQSGSNHQNMLNVLEQTTPNATQALPNVLPTQTTQPVYQPNQPTHLSITDIEMQEAPSSSTSTSFVASPSSTKRYVVTIPAQQLQMLNRDLADTQQITHVQFKTLTIQSFLTNLGSYSISTRRDELYR